VAELEQESLSRDILALVEEIRGRQAERDLIRPHPGFFRHHWDRAQSDVRLLLEIVESECP
jgi:hypothetical protein